MTAHPQFHEGQEVEALKPDTAPAATPGLFYKRWARAKIVCMAPDGGTIFNPVYEVQFHDGERALFDAEHIRAERSDLQDGYDDCHQCGRVP